VSPGKQRLIKNCS